MVFIFNKLGKCFSILGSLSGNGDLGHLFDGKLRKIRFSDEGSDSEKTRNNMEEEDSLLDTAIFFFSFVFDFQLVRSEFILFFHR